MVEYGIKIYFDRSSIKEFSSQLKQSIGRASEPLRGGGGFERIKTPIEQMAKGLKSLINGVFGMIKNMVGIASLIAILVAAADGIMKVLDAIFNIIVAMVRPFLNIFLPVFLAIATALLPFLKLMNMIFRPLYMALMKAFRKRAEQFKRGEISFTEFLAGVMQDTLVVFGKFLLAVFGEVIKAIGGVIIDSLSFVAKTIVVIFTGIAEVLVAAIGGLATLFASLFGEKAKGKVQEFFGDLIGGIRGFRDNALTYIDEMAAQLKEGLEGGVNAFLKLLFPSKEEEKGKEEIETKTPLDLLIEGFDTLADKLLDGSLYVGAFNFALEMLNPILSIASELVDAFKKALEGLQPVISNIVGSISNLITQIQTFWNGVVGAVNGFVSGLVDNIQKFAPMILAAIIGFVVAPFLGIPALIGAILGVAIAFVVENFENIKNAAIEWATNLWNTLNEKFDALKKWIDEKIKPISDSFGNIMKAVVGWVEWAVEKIRSLIDLANSIVDEAKSFAKSLIESAKKSLGFGGRSRRADDFILTPQGELIQTNPADYIVGVKDLGSLVGGRREVSEGTYNITINVNVRDGRDFVENIDKIVDEAVEKIMNRRLGAIGVYR